MMKQVSSYLAEGRYFYMAAGILFSIMLLFQLLAVGPQWRRVALMKDEETALRREQTELRALIKERRESASQFAVLSEEIETFIDGLPSERTMPRIIEEFHRIARRSGLAISSANYAPPSGRDGRMVRYTISFPLTGDYREIRKFIYNVEAMPYLLSIDDIALTSNKERSVALTLKLSLYFRSEKE